MVDGGPVSPQPVKAAPQLDAELVMAVDASGKTPIDANAGLCEVLLQLFEITAGSPTALEVQREFWSQRCLAELRLPWWPGTSSSSNPLSSTLKFPHAKRDFQGR